MAGLVPLMVDRCGFRDKRQAKEHVAQVTLRLQRSRIEHLTLEAFAAYLGRGCTWCGGCFEASTAGWGGFVCQRLFGLDFDNERMALTPDEVIARAGSAGLAVALHYQTLSSTHDRPRFRAVMDAGATFGRRDEASEYLSLLLALFPEADQSCRNLNRAFFGSNGHVELVGLADEMRGRHALEALRAQVPGGSHGMVSADAAPQARRTHGARRGRTTYGSASGTLKLEAPLLELVRRDTGEVGRMRSGRVDFDTCPICGHRRCFSYFCKSNLWHCYSSSNTTGYAGGSYVDYLLARGVATSVAEAFAMMREDTRQARGQGR